MNKEIISKKKKKKRQRDRKCKKIPNRNHRAKEHNNCTEEFNRGVYQQTGLLFGGLEEESTFTFIHTVGGIQFHATTVLCLSLGLSARGLLLASRDHPHSLALGPPPSASKAATMG